MVGVGVLLPTILVVFLVLVWRRKNAAFGRPMLAALVLTGFLAIAAVEFGWLVTEIGRQPFAIHGILRVSDAYTKGKFADTFGLIFPTLYLLLFGVTGWALVILRRLQTRPAESGQRPQAARKGRV
jgi:cytochrome d ubiquinol oxidase subunit I